MYNIKLIPYLVLYKYSLQLLHRHVENYRMILDRVTLKCFSSTSK